MSILTNIFVTPILLFISIPLATFALFTTSLAFSTLFIRVVIVYIELGVAVAQNHLTIHKSVSPLPSKSRPSSIQSRLRSKSRRSSTTSGIASETGSTTPKILDLLTKNNSTLTMNTIYGATIPDRDFEGVGGWRFPNPDDEAEEGLWTSINSRLELPNAIPGEHKRKHRRSMTSGSLTSVPLFDARLRRTVGTTGLRSPEGMTRPPMRSRARTPGTTSPDEIAGSGIDKLSSRSATSLQEAANTRRSIVQRKSSSSMSTTSDGSSIKSLQLQIP